MSGAGEILAGYENLRPGQEVFVDHACGHDMHMAFSKIPDAAHVPYCYWAIGFTGKQAYLAAEKAGTLDDLPTNHSPAFLPPLQPTLRTGTQALVAGALAWLAPH